MNDKLKGLLLGALLGSAITGTAAYASGVQIEVVFRPLTYLFDGVEKKPSEGSGFIYEGSTYVPLRFVSEALGKEVGWNEASSTITIDEPGFGQTAAIYKDNGLELKLTHGMIAKRAAIARLLDPSYDSYAKDASFLSYMELEVASSLLAEARLSEEAKENAKAEAEPGLRDLKEQFTTAFQGTYTWEGRLGELRLSEQDVLHFLQLNSTRDAYLARSASEDAIAAAYDKAKAAHHLDKATVRHILVGFKDQDGKARTKDEALARAKEARAKLMAGDTFEKLAAEYSDDTGSSSNGGQYADVGIADWVDGFRNAVLSQKIGEIGEPVETEYGYHVIKVEALTVPGIDEVRSNLKGELMEKAYQSLMNVELPALRQAAE